MDSNSPVANQARAVARAQRLEYFTIAWNSLEALIALLAGFLAGSVALVGFGMDSLIEVASGTALLWRLHRGERAERAALRIVGGCFVALAIYIAGDSAYTLWSREAPRGSIAGIALTAIAVVVMRLLARAKRQAAASLGSGALRADARQSEFCMYLSAIVLGGLLLNALFGWWWADPLAALVMVPVIAREGIDALRGKACGCGCH
jgi:divalent metal cation (Fe/Co/Zn/Cd) transporter